MDIQSVKQRFGIIGNSPLLNRAIDIAIQVAPTDISVLITGESGTGKEVFPKIIHQLGKRKHGNYIAVNCGAIPEGTIDSELFGHEKGSFTGAHDSRKGYFEVADGGTIFLDEVAELPLSTQVRLLRILETGEYLRVGSSKALKTDVRIVAATNVNLPQAIKDGKFREDLYYRLNTVPIIMPPLRERKEDIVLLFKKFANDSAEKYRMPPLQLTNDAIILLTNYRWSGNVRQLKNITEQISIIETERMISKEIIQKYLPLDTFNELPVLLRDIQGEPQLNERDLLYKVLFDMKKDIIDLKKLVLSILQNNNGDNLFEKDNAQLIKKLYQEVEPIIEDEIQGIKIHSFDAPLNQTFEGSGELLEESLSLQKKEIDFINKALEKHKGKRKAAADELGISERTLYRKIKEYNIKY